MLTRLIVFILHYRHISNPDTSIMLYVKYISIFFLKNSGWREGFGLLREISALGTSILEVPMVLVGTGRRFQRSGRGKGSQSHRPSGHAGVCRVWTEHSSSNPVGAEAWTDVSR